MMLKRTHVVFAHQMLKVHSDCQSKVFQRISGVVRKQFAVNAMGLIRYPADFQTMTNNIALGNTYEIFRGRESRRPDTIQLAGNVRVPFRVLLIRKR